MAATTLTGEIPQLLFARLATLSLSPSLEIAWPNRSTKPTEDAYLEVMHLPNATFTRAIGTADDNQHFGVFQVTVVHKPDYGIIKVNDIAGQIIAHFPRGTKLAGTYGTVEINRKAYAAPAFVDTAAQRVRVPVTIQYVCFSAS